MIAQELEVSLHMAFVEARQQRHEFITVEHLLMALLDNPSAAEVLRACAANIEDLRKSLSTFIKENTPTVGVFSLMKVARLLRRSSMLAAQARSTSAAEGLSSNAISKCSTVMNSWRCWRASTNAMCRLTSSSCAIMRPP